MATVNEAFAIALESHQAGRLTHAASIYQQILQQDPVHADVLHLMGVLSHQVGDLQTADQFIRRAIGVNRTVPEFYNSLGNLLCDQGQYEEAIALFQHVVEMCPHSETALLNLGSALYEVRRLEEARDTFKTALRINKDCVEAHNNLGNALKDLGETDQAVASYKRAIRLDPSYTEAHFNLGNLYRDRNEPEPAIAAYRQALAITPNFTSAHINLGILLNNQGQYEEALNHYQEALATGQKLGEVYNNMGNTYSSMGRTEEALACYQDCIRLYPDEALAYKNLGNEYFKLRDMPAAEAQFLRVVELEPEFVQGYFILGNIAFHHQKFHQAVGYYEQALAMKPDHVEALDLLAIVQTMLNQTEEAKANFEAAYQASGEAGYLVKKALASPAIFTDAEAMATWRNELISSLEALKEQGFTMQNPIREVGCTNFYQAYHGVNDLEIQKLLADVCGSMPTFPTKRTQPRDRRIEKPRIGFVSRMFRQGHTITKLNEGILHGLSRQRFDVRVFIVDDPANRSALMDMPPGESPVWIPEADLEEAARIIAEHDLDILFYADIGMDPSTYFLAYSRLAPIQCVTWGHPVSTGIPTVDYFLCTQGMEHPENASRHFSEELVLLENLPIYKRPVLPPNPKPLEAFGLSRHDHNYFCSQTLFKVHPDFDPIIADILRRDPQGRVSFIQLKHPELAAALLERFRQTMPDVVDRIVFLERMPYEDFVTLQSQVDVLLDTPHFGGGNTMLEAMAFGTPAITMPSEMIRCRLAYAFYRKMNMLDCVVWTPQEYADLAVRLGTDPAYREEIRQKILSTCDVLYDNPAILPELEAFFEQALDQAFNKALNLKP